MKKALIILAAIVVGAVLYVLQNPQLARKMTDQAEDIVTPETTTVYKWKDDKGQWQVSNQPPPGDTPYEKLEYDRNTNVLPSENTKNSSR